MFGLFGTINPTNDITTASQAVHTYGIELEILFPFLGIFLALTIFGLAVWGVKKLAGGGKRNIIGGTPVKYGRYNAAPYPLRPRVWRLGGSDSMGVDYYSGNDRESFYSSKDMANFAKKGNIFRD